MEAVKNKTKQKKLTRSLKRHSFIDMDGVLFVDAAMLGATYLKSMRIVQRYVYLM